MFRRRRTPVLTALLGLICLLVTACGGGAGSGASGSSAGGSANGGKIGEGQTLVVGGPQANLIQSIQSSGFDQAFKERTGADIQWIPGQAPDNLTKLVQSKGGKPPFDVTFLDNVEQYRGVQAGVLAQIKRSDLKDSGKSLPDQAFPNKGYGPAWVAIRLGSCINTASYSEHGLTPPNSIDGWFDPGLAGHINLPSADNFYFLDTMPAIAHNYGASLDKPKSVVDRFSKIKVTNLFTSSSDAQAALQSQAVWLTPITDGRCLGLKLGGQPVDFRPLNLKVNGKTWKYGGDLDTWDIAKGTDKAALATVFIDMVVGPLGTQGPLSQFGYIPARTDLQQQAKQDPKVSGLISDFSYDVIYIPSKKDLDLFIGNLREWTDEWTKAFSG
jgi:spermidine/putrescine-binding protein